MNTQNYKIIEIFKTTKNKIYKFFLVIWRFIFGKRFWIHILIVTIPPILLAVPIPLYVSYKIELIELPKEVVKNVSISSNVQYALGKSFFSKISGIDTYTMPTEVCIYNRNRITFNDELVDRKSLIDKNEAGAMEIVLEYPDGKDVPFYSPPNSFECEKFEIDNSTSTPVYLSNNPVFRHAVPIGQPIVESSKNGPVTIKWPVYQKSGIDFSKTRLFVVSINSKEFVFNLIIFFLAWNIIYLQFLQMWEFSSNLYSKMCPKKINTLFKN